MLRFVVCSGLLWSCLTVVCAAEPPETGHPRFLLEWGQLGDKPGEFHSPICVATSPSDDLFVADVNNSRIQRFTTEGKFVSEFELPRDQPERKQCIIGGLAADAEGLYLAFMMQHKIGVYSYDGKLLREWGSKGQQPGQFHQPGGLVIRSDGTIVIADQCNHRVQVFDRDGKFLREWGGHGADAGQFGGPEPAGSRFGGPHFLAQDREGRLYTTEGALGRIQQLDRDGAPLRVWGDKVREPGAFGEYTFGKLPNTFGPIGVFVDHRNRVWVSSLNDRVQAFTPEGRYLFALPTGPSGFVHPHGMAIDRAGHLYLADSGHQRIIKFALPDNPQ